MVSAPGLPKSCFCCCNLQAAKKLGHLLTFTSLKQLNVAFNELSSCDGIEQLQQLQSLNLSHNQLSSLGPISALTGLTRCCVELAGSIQLPSPAVCLCNQTFQLHQAQCLCVCAEHTCLLKDCSDHKAYVVYHVAVPVR